MIVYFLKDRQWFSYFRNLSQNETENFLMNEGNDDLNEMFLSIFNPCFIEMFF